MAYAVAVVHHHAEYGEREGDEIDVVQLLVEEKNTSNYTKDLDKRGAMRKWRAVNMWMKADGVYVRLRSATIS
jgi:hypothetical protein